MTTRSVIGCIAVLVAVGGCGHRAIDPDREAIAASIRHPTPGAGRPFQEFEDHDFYLCCNIRFNADRDANDANYSYADVGGSMLHAGARVHVVRMSYRSATIEPTNDKRTFAIGFRFGGERITAQQYYHNILRISDPTISIADAPPDVLDAIREGRLLIGMTKDQALIARGYPPFHHTAGVESDEWLYYQSRSTVDLVKFADGKIKSIERDAAP